MRGGPQQPDKLEALVGREGRGRIATEEPCGVRLCGDGWEVKKRCEEGRQPKNKESGKISKRLCWKT